MWPLQRHTAETLAAALSANRHVANATHYAADVTTGTVDLQLMRVYGANDSNGIPALSAAGIYTGDDTVVWGAATTAQALIFLHPDVFVLDATDASTVLGYVTASSGLTNVTNAIESAQDSWNTTVIQKDSKGNPARDPNGNLIYQYVVAESVRIPSVAVTVDAIHGIWSDASLKNTRWSVQDGVANVPITPAGNGSSAAATSNGYNITMANGGPFYGISAQVTNASTDSENLTLTVEFTNTYIRHVSVFANILKGDGTSFTYAPNVWWQYLDSASGAFAQAIYTVAAGLGGTLEALATSGDLTQPAQLLFVGLLGGESTFLGMPVAPTQSTFTLTIPVTTDTISTVRFFCGSLGLPSSLDFDPDCAWVGLGATLVLDMLVPTILLGMGIGEDTDTMFNDAPSALIFGAQAALQAYGVIKDAIKGENLDNIGGFFANLADSVVVAALQTGEIAAKLGTIIAGEEATDAIPFVGWVLQAEAIMGTVEQISQTIGESIGSARVVEFDVTVTMTTVINVSPDPSDKSGLPASATYYELTAQYSSSICRTLGVVLDTRLQSLTITWDDSPVGGTVTFAIAFYDDTGQLVGMGSTPSMDNILPQGQTTLQAAITITEVLHPLDDSTTYTQAQILQMNGSAHEWTVSPTAPTQTATSLGSGSAEQSLQAIGPITVNEDNGIIGYCWRASWLDIPPAGQSTDTEEPLYVFQNISMGPDPDTALMWCKEGFEQPLQLSYILSGAGASSSIPLFFYLDPTGTSSTGYALRSLTPSAGAFNVDSDASWGRFAILPTSLAVHVNGLVIAVASGIPKLQILQLPSAPSSDDEAPWAFLCSGPGTRPGLLSNPQLVAIAPDQTILVLDAGQSVITAFSSGGHPIQEWPANATSENPNGGYYIPLYVESTDSTNVTFLSMSVELKGYIYVLSVEDSGSDVNQYRLDVYSPAGGHLFRQRGLNAGGAAVDMWRNLYTVNYQPLTGGSSAIEPSIGQWVPQG